MTAGQASRNLRVLHVTPLYAPAWQFGGPVRSTHEITSGLVARGHEVAVVTTSCGTPDEGSRDVVTRVIDGVTVSYCPLKQGPFGLVSRAMREVAAVHAGRVDVAHVTGVWQPSVRGVYGDLNALGVPYVSSPRGALSPYSFRHGWAKKCLYFELFERRFARGAATLHATAPLEEAELAQLLPNAPIRVIPNACDPSKWYPESAAGASWRKRHGVSADEFVIAHVGRIHPKKNLDFLVEAVSRISAKRAWRLALHGPTAAKDLAYRDAVVRQLPAGRLVIDDGAGGTAETRAAYCSADILVFPSLHENFGNVLVESLLCGTPVVTSPNVGAAAFFRGTDAVRIVALEPSDWGRELSDRIAMAQDARRRNPITADVAAICSPSAVTMAIESMYCDILSRPQKSGSLTRRPSKHAL